MAARIMRRVRALGRGAVVVPRDFLDFGSRAAIDQALSRLAKSGLLRRVARGVYDYPRTNVLLGITMSPSADALAQALARKTNRRLQVSGAQAANTLGLSTQVPAKNVFLTDGSSRVVQAAHGTVELRHAPAHVMAGAGRISGVVISALHYLGRETVDDNVIRHLRDGLSPDDKKRLRQDAKSSLRWMQPIVDKITN